MKTLDDYEKQLKCVSVKTHDLQLEADHVHIDTALALIEEAAKNSFERGYCTALVTKPNTNIEQIAEDLKDKWKQSQQWFDKEFSPNSLRL